MIEGVMSQIGGWFVGRYVEPVIFVAVLLQVLSNGEKWYKWQDMVLICISY